MNPILQGILVGLVVGTVMALFAYFLGGLRQKKTQKSDEVLRKETLAIEAVKERDEKIRRLQIDVAQLQKGAIPIEAAMQAAMLAGLTHSDEPDADALIKKASNGTLTKSEAIKFAAALKEREADPNVGEAEQIRAKILPDVMRLNELLKENPDGCETKTVLVNVPATVTVAARDGGTQQEEKGN